jgi:putative ABC transport system permease protein
LSAAFWVGIVYDQLQFLRQTDLGFTESPVIRCNLNQAEDRQKWPVLRQHLLTVLGVQAAATTGSAPGQGYSKNLMPIETNEGNLEEKGLNLYPVDFDYLTTMEMELPEGRGFDRSRPTDSTLAVVVNQAMISRMGWQDPLGKKVRMNIEEEATEAQVIGVVGDYHHQSLYALIEPMLLFYRPNNRTAVVRISAENLKGTLQGVEQAWAQTFPNKPFEYDFQDEAFMEQYEADRHRSRLFTLFSGLTILIACLGLLGLASFTAEQRTKEIGIRKVLGASARTLMLLLTREFLLLVLLATPLAFAAAYGFMVSWLEEFAYHAPLNFWTFLWAMVLTVAITLGTTSWHAYRAASLNPTEALCSE